MEQHCSFCDISLTNEKGETHMAIYASDNSETIKACKRCGPLALKMIKLILEGMLNDQNG